MRGYPFYTRSPFPTFFLCYNRVNDSERIEIVEKILAGVRDATDGFGLYQYWPGLWCGGVSLSYSPLELALMSILVYARAAQFAMISLIAAHSSDLEYGLDGVF